LPKLRRKITVKIAKRKRTANFLIPLPWILKVI